MEINPNRNVDPALPVGGPVRAKGAARLAGEPSFEQSAGLDTALAAVPDTRAEVIARAEKLVSSPNYPPPEMIRRIATLLAASLLAGE